MAIESLHMLSRFTSTASLPQPSFAIKNPRRRAIQPASCRAIQRMEHRTLDSQDSKLSCPSSLKDILAQVTVLDNHTQLPANHVLVDDNFFIAAFFRNPEHELLEQIRHDCVQSPGPDIFH